MSYPSSLRPEDRCRCRSMLRAAMRGYEACGGESCSGIVELCEIQLIVLQCLDGCFVLSDLVMQFGGWKVVIQIHVHRL